MYGKKTLLSPRRGSVMWIARENEFLASSDISMTKLLMILILSRPPTHQSTTIHWITVMTRQPPRCLVSSHSLLHKSHSLSRKAHGQDLQTGVSVDAMGMDMGNGCAGPESGQLGFSPPDARGLQVIWPSVEEVQVSQGILLLPADSSSSTLPLT